MKPYYQDDLVTLYHGDCLEHPEWWTNADVLVTDPPYGIGWHQRAMLTRGLSEGYRSREHSGIQNDENTDARDYALELWGEKPALVHGDIMKPFPAHTRRVLVWQKPKSSGLMGSTIWRKDWEPIFMAGKWPLEPATESSVLVTSGAHWKYVKDMHPHAKPVSLMSALITKCPAGVVADPFAGSGSTLVAAKALGRRCIGVELEERYCEIAANRCAQEVLPLWNLGGTA